MNSLELWWIKWCLTPDVWKNRKRATVSGTWTVCLCWLEIDLYFCGWSCVCYICTQTLHTSVFDELLLSVYVLSIFFPMLILIISKYLFFKNSLSSFAANIIFTGNSCTPVLFSRLENVFSALKP